jgi:adenylate kinase family enzyme
MGRQFNTHSKILVVGTSGSGKSTLARKLASMFQLTDIELDALFWEPNWTEVSQPVFRERIEQAMVKNPGWVVHGNYSKVRDLTWGRADTVIWLDYSLPVVLWRVTKRSIARIITNEALWSGNRESFKKTFCSRESIILWSLQTYHLRKQQYETLIQDPANNHLQIIRMRSPIETNAFLRRLDTADVPAKSV